MWWPWRHLTGRDAGGRPAFRQGSPLLGQIQELKFPTGYSGGIGTPFGVPLWGGDPILGPASLIIQADNGDVCEVNFDVVA